MSFLRQVELAEGYAPFISFRENFGFVPSLFRAQTLLPHLIEAQAHVAAAVLLTKGALSPARKQQILLLNAAAQQNSYCAAMHCTLLRKLGSDERYLAVLLADYRSADLTGMDTAILDFSLKLGLNAPAISETDVAELRSQNYTDEAILETILVTALARFLCTLSEGLGTEPDFEPPKLPAEKSVMPGSGRGGHIHAAGKGPYLHKPDPPPEFAPFAFLQRSFGFIPNIFRAQTLRPDVLEAETHAISAILLPENLLSRVQKECILLVLSAANFNTYCVAVHCEMLRGLGMPSEESSQIALDHQLSRLSAADKTLLDFALKLGTRPTEFGKRDIDGLREQGFREEQILEAVVMTALTNFLNTLQMGLGTVPDYEPRIDFAERLLSLDFHPHHHAAEKAASAAGAALAAKIQAGDLQAFEQLVRDCGRRVYRTLVAILGDATRAEEASDDCFLKIYRRIDELCDPAKFSVRIVALAKETALERASPAGSSDLSFAESGEEESLHRPRELFTWPTDAGKLYSRSETQKLVEGAVTKIPAKYRVAVVLRDLEGLPVAIIAEAFGIAAPIVLKRLAQGRMMLVELLGPHFAKKTRRAAS